MQSRTVGDRFPKWFYIAVPLFSVIATLLLIELVLCIFYPLPYSMEINMYYEPDPYTGYRLAPNSIGYFQRGIVARTNSLGQRDVEHSLKKPASVYRVLVIGDSFTVGTNVEQEEAYPKVIEELLNKRTRRKVEVINTGVGGWDPFEYAQYYEYYGRAFEPDLVVVGFFVGNDTYSPKKSVEELNTAIGGRRVSRKAAERVWLTKVKIFLYENSNLARLLLGGSVKARAQDYGKATYDRADCADFTDRYLEIQKSRKNIYLKLNKRVESMAMKTVNQIKRIKIMADEEHVPVWIVLIPDETQINPLLRERVIDKADMQKYDFDMPQKLLDRKFEDIGVKVIDLLPIFRADPRCLYLNDTHWTAEGHRLAADRIFNNLSSAIDAGAQH